MLRSLTPRRLPSTSSLPSSPLVVLPSSRRTIFYPSQPHVAGRPSSHPKSLRRAPTQRARITPREKLIAETFAVQNPDPVSRDLPLEMAVRVRVAEAIETGAQGQGEEAMEGVVLEERRKRDETIVRQVVFDGREPREVLKELKKEAGPVSEHDISINQARVAITNAIFSDPKAVEALAIRLTLADNVRTESSGYSVEEIAQHQAAECAELMSPDSMNLRLKALNDDEFAVLRPYFFSPLSPSELKSLRSFHSQIASLLPPLIAHHMQASALRSSLASSDYTHYLANSLSPAEASARDEHKAALDFALTQLTEDWKGLVMRTRQHLTKKSHEKYRAEKRREWEKAEEGRKGVAGIEARERRKGERAEKLAALRGKEGVEHKAEREVWEEEQKAWEADQDQGKREAIKASSEADVEKRREMERKLLGEGKKQQEAPVEEDA